ncbi:MAG: DNA-directed RNA polymerase subunit L [archaeon]|nr:DNA-directed RNA polymerase subunit L [Nanoarchaeota archaeon]
MEFKVIEESKNKLTFELEGETHTFCNLLKTELRKVKGVELVGYRIDHPLVGVPNFLLETKGIEPRKALKEALKNIKDLTKDFEKQVKKL